MNPLDLYSGGLDNRDRSEFLKHYGVKGMKWKKKKHAVDEYGNRIVDEVTDARERYNEGGHGIRNHFITGVERLTDGKYSKRNSEDYEKRFLGKLTRPAKDETVRKIENARGIRWGTDPKLRIASEKTANSIGKQLKSYNRPTPRKKNVSGEGKNVYKRKRRNFVNSGTANAVTSGTKRRAIRNKMRSKYGS